MKVSLQWLKRHLPGLAAPAEELEQVLPLLGIEVDAVAHTGLPPLQNVVVGEVRVRAQHPQADRLSVCEVDTGAATPHQIVCGATNFQPGDRVPVALPGAVLPGGFKIKKTKLRGVESGGMMCSAKELGLGEDHAGLLVLEERPEVGKPLNEVFTGSDTVFTCEVTSNRGDCLSHRGVARELAAWYGLELQAFTATADAPRSSAPTPESLLERLEVPARDCPYYTAWCVQGVKIASSPAWLRRDLEAVGLRPVNNVVDITNWVMMEFGQPLHAFDAGKINGKALIIRNAREGETITTLDGRTRTLTADMMVIADARRPLVIAGVMGSLDAEVDGGTTDLVLESAWFSPGSIRAASRKLSLSTDSSYRFARNVDPQMVAFAARTALDMILEYAGGGLAGPAIVAGEPPRGPVTIGFEPGHVRTVAGYDVDDATVQNTLERLGFGVEAAAGPWKVTVPTHRWEVTRPIDLVEEVLRLHGTARIPEADVAGRALSREDDALATFNRRAADFLAAQRFTECYHYSLRRSAEIGRWFGEPRGQALGLANPLTSEMSHLRASLLPGLLDGLRLNRNNGNAVSRLFETGRVFWAGADGEVVELAAVEFVLLVDPVSRTWKEREAPDFYTARRLAGDLADLAGFASEARDWRVMNEAPAWQPGHAAIAGSWQDAGWELMAGSVSFAMLKEWDIASPVLAGAFLVRPDRLKPRKARGMQLAGFSSYPPATKDIAILVPAGTPAEAVRREVEHAAREAAGEDFALEGVSVFDVYEGKGLPEGTKSLAFAITWRSPARTLKDKEVNNAFDVVQRTLMANDNYQVRS